MKEAAKLMTENVDQQPMVQNAESGEDLQNNSNDDKDNDKEDSKLPPKETTKDAGEEAETNPKPAKQIQEVSGSTSSCKVLPKEMNYEQLSPYFLYRPRHVIKKTLENTTQLASAIIHQPLQRHVKSRFQMLRLPRLMEVLATDTYFSNTKSIEGFWCSQVFYGCTSRMLSVEGMKTESDFPMHTWITYARMACHIR